MTKEKDNVYEFNYFKVNEKILELEELKKAELWVYLTHCRSRGTKSIGYRVRGEEVSDKKTVIYSTAALTKVRELFDSKINKRSYNNAIKSLEEKGLIYAIDIEKTGINKRWYKSKKAIEIVEPKDTINIQLPYEMLDNKIMAEMTVEEIKTVIELYKNYNYESNGLGSIDIDCIMAQDEDNEKGYRDLNTKFGSGFNRAIYGKRAIAVTDFNYIETDLDIDIVNKLIDKKLFKFKPVIIEYDLEDESLFKLRYELFKNLVGFADEYNADYVIAELEEDKGIIWVLEPVYRIDTKPNREYLDNYSRAYTRAVLLYTKTDLLTDKKHRRYALYNYETYEELESLVDYYTLERVLELKEELYNITEKNALYIFYMEQKLEDLSEQHIEEYRSIEKENERLKVEEGYRSRSKSSPRLRALDKEMEQLDHIISEEKIIIEELEKELLDLIPIQAMERFFFEGEGYQSENVGKVTRIIN